MFVAVAKTSLQSTTPSPSEQILRILRMMVIVVIGLVVIGCGVMLSGAMFDAAKNQEEEQKSLNR
jgi:hypothetical protein